MTISTKEQLRDHIHSIHDFLRNCGAGYGMTAMKIFMIFYGLKIIEPIIHKTKLNPDICTFSNIIKNAKKKHKEASDPVSAFIDDDILDDITKIECRDRKFNISWYMFHQIPRGLSDKVWKQVVKYIDEIPTNKNRNGKKINDAFDVDLSGKVYEYFIGRDATAISELGAYFTDRHITGYVMDKVKPTLKNGHVRTMIDMFGGSGGFTLGYTQYLNSTFGDKIDWKTDINNIYHYDMNEDVIKIAGLEMFGLTEQLPNKDTNFRRVNTFKNEFGNERYYYIFTNPPYGGDKNKKNTETLKYDKLLAYVNKDLVDIKEKLKDDPENKILLKTQKQRMKQVKKLKETIVGDKKGQDEKKVNEGTCSQVIKDYIKKNKMKTCNDKEACSLVLLMALLDKNGVCAGVLKEGVFFDKKYGSIRKCLVENFNVKYVVSVPQDQFENTSTKTSIVIFENTKEKTEEIIFYDLIVEKEKDDVFDVVGDEIQIVKSKDDIICVTEKEVCRCNIKDMKDDYSLNYKNYLNNDIKVQKGFKLVKLGDICETVDGYAFKKDDIKHTGVKLIQISNIQNNMVVFSDTVKYVKYNESKHKKIVPENGDIIIGMTGNIQDKIAIYTKSEICVLNQRVCKINNFKNNVSKSYVYNYWKVSKLGEYMQFKANGTVQKNISKQDILNTKIPYPDTNTMKKLEPTLTKLMKLHEESQKLSNDIPQKEKDICALMKKLTDGGTEGVDYEEKNIMKIIKMKDGDFNSKDMKINEKYPFYNASVNNPVGTIDKCCFKNDRQVLFVKSGGNSKNKISESHALALPILVKGYCSSNVHVSQLTLINNAITYDYLYYCLKILRPLIQDNAKYSTGLGGVDMDHFRKLKLKILAPKTIKKQLQPLFDEVDKMKSNLEENKKEHSELSIKFMRMIDPEYKNSSDSDIENSNNSDSEDNNDNSDTNNTLKIKKKKKDNS